MTPLFTGILLAMLSIIIGLIGVIYRVINQGITQLSKRQTQAEIKHNELDRRVAVIETEKKHEILKLQDCIEQLQQEIAELKQIMENINKLLRSKKAL